MDTYKVTIYEPNQRVRMGFFKSWAMMVRGVAESRELIWQLFKRDFFSNYKQSLLGIVWIFIAPVIGIVSWVFLNAAGVLMPGDVGVPYPVYVLVGSTVWGLFIGFFSTTSRSLQDSGSLILQINFPHEALVVKQAAQTVAAFVINLALIIIVLFAFGVMPDWRMVFFPLAVLPLLFLGTAIGMVVSVVSVVAHDFGRAVASLLGFAMFITPVIYAPKFQNETLQAVVRWNPLTYLVGGARDIILYGNVGSEAGYASSAALSLFLLIVSWRIFFLSEHKVVERL